MKIPQSKHNMSEFTITLPVNVDMKNIVALYEELVKATQAGKVLIHANNVERINTAGAQVLVALEKSLKSIGNSLHIINPSEPFRTALTDLGLGLQLKEWSGA